VFEVGESESQLYLTMAYIDGETLAARLSHRGPFPVVEAVELVRKISRAMAEAHERGIVHRDLKPSNIMLDRRGQPVIMDFGLAMRAAASGNSRLTQSGVALGTPCYMPPEQAVGDHAAIGPAADVYSLGVILFELVTGQLPFQGHTFGKILAQIERDPPPWPHDINPAVDERLSEIIVKALAKAPADRFASAAALADAFDAYLAEKLSGEASIGKSRMAQTTDWKAQRPTKAASHYPSVRWLSKKRYLSAGVLGALLVGFASAMIYVATDNGTLIVELSDPAANVDVRVNGKGVVLDPEGNAVRIRAGKDQQLEVSGQEYRTVAESFDLMRGGSTVVRVTLVPKAGDTPNTANNRLRPPPVMNSSDLPIKRVSHAAPHGLIELPGWHLVAGATQEEMQGWLEDRKYAKHSVQWLDVVKIRDQPVFAAIAALDDRAPDWQAFLDLNAQEVNDYRVIAKRFDVFSYTLTSISAYTKGRILTGVALYHRGKSDLLMVGILNMLGAKANLAQVAEQGDVVRVLRPFTTSSGQLFCAMCSESAVNTPSRHDIELSEAELWKMLDIQRAQGAYPVSVVPYEVNNQLRFAATFREDPTRAPWELALGLPLSERKTKAMEFVNKGMIPVSVIVYPSGNETRFCVVWRRDSHRDAEQ
jgi:hypothetical protein